MKNKKIIGIVVAVVVIVLGAVFLPRLIHKCDDCGEVFVGTGYKANALVEMVSDDEEDDLTICKECAKKHHAFSTELGGADLDEFKKPLF